MIEKQALRKEMAARRAAAHGTVNPTPALAHLESALDEATHPISFYWPIRSEIDPRPVMETFSKRGPVCLPVTSGYNPLTFRVWTPGALLDVDGFGVSVPSADNQIAPRTLVLPLLAFDARGQRLGYGAGHYDRTLDQLRKRYSVRAIGFAYSAQECEMVPTEATDQPLDLIVTEQGAFAPQQV